MNPHYQVPTQVPSPMGLPESNFIYFYHSDHLTSTSFVTDGGGEIYEHVEYFPQGEIWADERSNTERLPYLFTSEEMDQETGLYDFGARMYDPRTALWNSPDPAAPSYLDGAGLGGVWNPANLSSMTYALNNPLLFRDPDGRSGTVDHDPANNVIMDRQKQIAVWLGSLSNRRVTFVHGKLTLGDAVRGGHNAGTRLLERIVASDQNVHITYDSGERVAGTEPMSQRNARNGRGSDATVRVNFDAVATRDPATSRLVEGTGGEAVSQTSAPEIVLGHELIHADHMMRGVERRSIYERHAGLYHWNMTPGGRIFERAPIEEARTVGLPGARLSRIDVTENMLRDEGGYAARVRYFAPDIRGWRATPGPHWDR